ncbi:MAG: hypothetical protein MZV70_48685 [Desulfobacterales bacterium]|nr:hypothetical protein [Desulfobacterales bacterium]
MQRSAWNMNSEICLSIIRRHAKATSADQRSISMIAGGDFKVLLDECGKKV